jgi:glycosidase
MVDAEPVKVDNWTGFLFFAKGSTMIYAGQEYTAIHKPSLFEKEDVKWEGRDLSPLIRRLATIVTMDHFSEGVFDIHLQDKDVIVSSYQYNNETVVGIFNVGDTEGSVVVPVPDGTYEDLLSRETVTISKQTTNITKQPVIFVV